ncbi:rap guanine nucleotide exchange factor 1 isoform X2 [Antennarius striatus]|uniref:rap guanine nucleotide exchange factor 1 isoform X2 n=1 Tax=Antennarius striatus TaxID=241820 RepID=UPI0035B30FD9
MSSRAESKTASQFASLTMKLKDKLQQQRIRYSERIKHTPTVTPPDPKQQENSNAPSDCESVSVLADQQRAVISSLQYFKALVDRLGVDKLILSQPVVGNLLGGASSGVLEAVQALVHLEPHLHNSKTVSSCLTCLYQSMAQLIRWADQVMMKGITQESKDSVTTVIRAVLDGVKELVRLVAERQDGRTPVSPVQLEPDAGRPGQFDQQLTSQSTSNPGSPAEEDEKTDLAPPKPPIPSLKPLPQASLAQSPPALPPKTRKSSLSPAPCTVAIVAPMIRECEVERHIQQEDCLRRSSSSSVCADNTHCDPDYDFLLTDLFSSDALPPLPHTSSVTPALPEKRRCSSEGQTNPESSFVFGFDSAQREDSPAHYDITDELQSSPLSPSKTPPPLPEKKRHIHQYLQVCSSYSAETAAMFYQRPLTSRQRRVETNDHLTDTDLKTHLGSWAQDSAPRTELLPVPSLPPKKRQQDSVETNNQSEERPTRDGLKRLQQETDHDQKNREHEDQEDQEDQEVQEDQEEVLLTDKQEILHRIMMKADEEGLDVKAASPNILLVYATETDSNNDLYREAFVATYRGFISPNDVICKLQHRYRHLCKECKSADQTTANKTFHLLVTVVEELRANELDSDLLAMLMDLVFSLLVGGELRLAHLLRSNILSKMEQRWQLIGSPQSPRPLAARSVAARPGTLLDFHSQDLAEQLTLLDAELFYKIKPPEVLLWSKEQNEEQSLNLTQFTQHFNNVSFWVRSVIILQDKPQDREKLLLKFLKIMKHLRKLNNFNSYLSILSALDSAPLRRLDWQRNTAEVLEEYSSLIDSSSSFRAYRAALAEVKPPCIPYLGMILQDLTFVHIGNPDTLMTPQGSKVNFTKCWQQFNILDTLRSYQQMLVTCDITIIICYSIQPDDDIISFFNDFSDHLAEEALWELSLRLRPRNVSRVIQ